MTSNSSRYLCCQIISAKETVNIDLPSGNRVRVPANHLILILDDGERLHRKPLHSGNCIHFSRQFIKDYISFMQVKPDFYQGCTAIGPEYIIVKSEKDDVFANGNIYPARKMNAYLYCEEERLLLFSLLSLFSTDSSFLSLLNQAIEHTVTMKVYTTIKQDMIYPWRVEDVAKHLNMSVSLLKLRLRQEGTCYIHILTDCRMRYAQEQLIDRRKSIANIAALCGYTNVDYFTSVFRKQAGMTPLQYRLNQRLIAQTNNEENHDISTGG
ncbi:helix-turn-helix transcriptional regulator (plasmid) [Edwardsiella tarda]|uniref:helix-turn-helix transcriptional regulator n=1 Tax=Edwardsiella tarda TaxID=636 RepID=UPI002444F02B|nr:helix-turn-helix transcriptional regulator [Edwardsiella tarda]WGE30889.1 helix-turn-helix transcriptional regulator [Edwardsiella tarda]